MVMSSTERPSGHAAVDVATTPLTLLVGGAQSSVARQMAITDGTAGPSMCAKPSPRPPLYGMLRSAVPWMWMTEIGAGAGHGPRRVAESGPMAANSLVSQARRYASRPPLEM